MTIDQIKAKIANLDVWLKANPNDTNRHLVENDKRALILQLSHHSNDTCGKLENDGKDN